MRFELVFLVPLLKLNTTLWRRVPIKPEAVSIKGMKKCFDKYFESITFNFNVMNEIIFLHSVLILIYNKK